MYTIQIKNMVCQRCISSVEDILNNLNIPFQNVILGQVITDENIDQNLLIQFEKEIENIGFFIIHNENEIVVNNIKALLIHQLTRPFKEKLSSIVSNKLDIPYNNLNAIFSEIEGMTIEKYYVHLRIEKVKELLSYGESLKQIALKLNYSSIAHLSKQFKEITGESPSVYRNSKVAARKFLDQI